MTKLLARCPDTDLEAIVGCCPLTRRRRCDSDARRRLVRRDRGAGVGKEHASRLLQPTGASTAATVVTFGDHLTDAAMVAWAGHGVAVANAHPSVLAVADEVTPSNDEDGVAIVLERLAYNR